MSDFAVDLHVHTVLSPCAERNMTPCAVAARAKERGIALLALCDHDVVGAASRARATDKDPGITVLDGVELTTSEGAHVLGILPGGDAARALALHLGLGTDDRPDSAAEPMAPSGCPSVREAVRSIHRFGGLAIAAHVDRPSSGLIGRLGALPDVGFDAVEVSPAALRGKDLEPYERYGLPVVVGSDAHDLSSVGKYVTWLSMEAPDFASLALALRQRANRRLGRA